MQDTGRQPAGSCIGTQLPGVLPRADTIVVLAGAIERLIENPDLLERMARNNHRDAAARFAASAVARRFEALHERLAQEVHD